MKNSLSFYIKIATSLIGALTFAQTVEAYQVIPGGTYTTPLVYNLDPQGAIILPGNTVIFSGNIVTFTYGLTIDSNAVLINQGDTIKMGDGQRIYLVQTPSFDTVIHGAKLILNNSVITSLSSSVNGALWQGIECMGSLN